MMSRKKKKRLNKVNDKKKNIFEEVSEENGLRMSALKPDTIRFPKKKNRWMSILYKRTEKDF